jgi:hypothetical protein
VSGEVRSCHKLTEINFGFRLLISVAIGTEFTQQGRHGLPKFQIRRNQLSIRDGEYADAQQGQLDALRLSGWYMQIPVHTRSRTLRQDG